MDIWIYTFDVWGKIQADNYVQAIYSAICLLVENPQMGKSREALQMGYRSYYQSKHVIFSDRPITVYGLFVFCIKVWIMNGIYPENQHQMLGCEKMQPNLPGYLNRCLLGYDAPKHPTNLTTYNLRV